MRDSCCRCTGSDLGPTTLRQGSRLEGVSRRRSSCDPGGGADTAAGRMPSHALPLGAGCWSSVASTLAGNHAAACDSKRSPWTISSASSSGGIGSMPRWETVHSGRCTGPGTRSSSASSGYYAKSPTRNPTGPSTGETRVIRGGAYEDVPRAFRASNRGFTIRTTRNAAIGFRCAASPSATSASAAPGSG